MLYNRQRRHLRLTMSKAIDTVLHKHRLQNCRTYKTPAEEFDGNFGEPNETFDIRGIFGSLQYIQSMGRPDISY